MIDDNFTKGKSFGWVGLIYVEARQCQEAMKAATGSYVYLRVSAWWY